jgi:class 3 adenylate cyclase
MPPCHDAERTAADRAVERTIVFSDVVGSTAYAVVDGDERLDDLLDRHDRIVHDAITDACGHVVKNVGDGATIAFRRAHDAIETAIEIQRRAIAAAILLRIGADHGVVLAVGDHDYRGLVANVAARLTMSAGAGQIVLSDRVARAANFAGPTQPCVVRGVRGRQRVRTLSLDRPI